MKQLFVEQKSFRFRHTEEDKLKKQLELIDSKTILHPVRNPKDAYFDSDANVTICNEKYRMTRWALYQLCKQVCSGLYLYLQDYSGQNSSGKHTREAFSFDEALSVLNKTVQRRFRSHLEGHMFLRNLQDRTIDAVVGSSYRWVSNLEIYSRVRELVSQSFPPSDFAEASLYGRWLLLRYLQQDPFLTIPCELLGEERFYTGFHFSNNEVGKASVKANNTVVRKFGLTSAIVKPEKNALAFHVGSNMTIKLDKMFGSLSNKPTVNELATNLNKLETTFLHTDSVDPKIQAKTTDEIASKLARYKIPWNVAKSIVVSMLYRGSYDKEQVPLFHPIDRTVYDLYNALGREAKRLPINLRELLENAAYSVLVGKIHF